MYSIDVDFEVYKQLTVRRATEDVTYNDVIRDLLGLASLPSSLNMKEGVSLSSDDWVTKGVRFPSGTKFRARYKGQLHAALVERGALVLSDGKRFDSPSAAAMAITGSSVNGWRFWEGKLPGKPWQLIEGLRR